KPTDATEADKARLELRRNMLRSIITEPLLSHIRENPDDSFDVIISLNEFFRGGMDGALEEVKQRAKEWKVPNYAAVSNYVFGRLTADQIQQLAAETQALNAENRRNEAVVYRIWEDSDISVTLTRSLTTVKADAAQRSFHAVGEGIVWAVLDSGIDGAHAHFAEKLTMHGRIDTLGVPAPVEHRDYTPDGDERAALAEAAASAASGASATSAPPPPPPPSPAATRRRPGALSALEDNLGHGSHVGGIIAGYWTTDADDGLQVVGTEVRDESIGASTDTVVVARESLKSISGVAPMCKLVSLKVIADRTLKGNETRPGGPKQTKGQGKVSWVLRALDDIQRWNQNGKRILIHGVNMSLGYEFDPRWFACGQSPICAEVNRMVRTGVCVVVSAGNSGYSSYISGSGKEENSYNALSITDPGNAELAITVGSTHRDMPHTYGVSYFSSRGPTGDGRRKPDLLAPGERIRSCAAGEERERYGVVPFAVSPPLAATVDPPTPGTTAHAIDPNPTTSAIALPSIDRAPENGKVLYCEQTGTSMAAPHVSGALAAFLSVRTEFIGQPERVKALFLANAIDLGREVTFQGYGLLDLMKVLQAV
ncbi:MAG: S8 family serine peptidase, partial [Gemmatimonadota bacterium]